MNTGIRRRKAQTVCSKYGTSVRCHLSIAVIFRLDALKENCSRGTKVIGM